MKPTPEIIELAKQIWKKGWRQDIREGDWYMVKGHWRPALSTAEMGGATVAQQGEGLVPIPDLSQCLRWLTENGDPDEIDLAPYGNIWRIHYDCFTYTHAEAPTPEEACMKAMLKILEGE